MAQTRRPQLAQHGCDTVSQQRWERTPSPLGARKPLRSVRRQFGLCPVQARTIAGHWLLALLSGVVLFADRAPAEAAPAPVSSRRAPVEYLSPAVLSAAADGRTLYIGCATANQVVAFDPAAGKIVRTIAMPAPPSGLVLTPDKTRLYVTCAAPASQVCAVDLAAGAVTARLPAGHTAVSPVLSPDGKSLCVCYRFDNCVAVFDLAQQKESCRIPVAREPIAAALTPNGEFLLVAHHLPAERADADVVAGSVSVIDLAARAVTKQLQLPNGSSLLRDLRISPDARYACVTHNLARFHMPTTQLERGWMNTSALTLIDLGAMRILNTVLLDDVDRGAANPWAAAWSADGKTLGVTHAGTHELSVIDVPALLAKLARLPTAPDPSQPIDYSAASRIAADVPNDLSFLVGIRQRVKLTGIGPRALVVAGSRVYVANYYSDTLDLIDLNAPTLRATSIGLGSRPPISMLRRGEMLFNDATICFQSWQSCASCHSDDARVDGLNWDLLNDGVGNPKNSRSLLWSHKTPPAMSMGIRETAETAVRAGIQHILFSVQPEEVPTAIDEWLKSLEPVPSPHLVHGKPSPAARRGEKTFRSQAAACASCHPSGLFTDLAPHDVGTRGQFDQEQDQFDTPTLVEVWRTAPYLHDGSAATLYDVLIPRNRENRHGQTSRLTKPQIDDLIEYLLSL